MDKFSISPIAYIHNGFKDKFGIPRQSGLANECVSTIIFEEKYRDENALRGLDGYSHLWLLWVFDDKNTDADWSATVRPPRLGGNKRMGVFATRSPYHPNGIGLSCVKIHSIEKDNNYGTIIKVLGADLKDNTPIIDIKPYLSFTDSIPDAVCGFADDVKEYELNVIIPRKASLDISKNEINEIISILKQDPRPSYQCDSERIYAMIYGEYEIKFKVDNKDLTVLSIQLQPNGSE